METRLTKRLGIKYPIFQGGMAWVAEHQLASAVSNAGGLGIIAGASAPVDVVRREIRLAKEKTDRPFAVNLMLMSPYAEDIAQMLVEEEVKVVTTGAGNPGKYMKMWKEAGMAVIPVVASAGLAVLMERAGADALVAEGCEAGGHIGDLTTMTLVPQVVDRVDIPVIAAGGIADSRAVVAAFALGAEGIQVGTRFLVADECQVHENYKNKVISAKDIDTDVTGRSSGHPVRVLRNKMSRLYMKLEKEGVDMKELEELGQGSLRKAVKEGDLIEGSFMAGQSAGLVKKRQSCKEIIEDLFAGVPQVLDFKNIEGWDR